MASVDFRALRICGFALIMLAGCFSARLSPAAEAGAEIRGIEIQDAWARRHPTRAGEIGVYFDVVNHRDEADKLRRVSSGVADRANFMRLTWKDSQPRVDTLSEIPIPGSSRTSLTPDGWYIALTGAQSHLAPGDSVRISLSFANAGAVEIDVKITNQLLGNRGR